MKYKQKQEKSRPYEYGEGKEFATREEAMEMVEKRRQKIITEVSLAQIYSIVELEIIEEKNSLQLVATKKEPIIFEENQE